MKKIVFAFLFLIAASSFLHAAPQLELAVEWNNPFNPSAGQVTRFRFATLDRDRTLALRVYTVSGQLVREWSGQVTMGSVYTVDWDGKNDLGEIVARGIYLVNISDADNPAVKVTRRVAVIKQQ